MLCAGRDGNRCSTEVCVVERRSVERVVVDRSRSRSCHCLVEVERQSCVTPFLTCRADHARVVFASRRTYRTTCRRHGSDGDRSMASHRSRPAAPNVAMGLGGCSRRCLHVVFTEFLRPQSVRVDEQRRSANSPRCHDDDEFHRSWDARQPCASRTNRQERLGSRGDA